MTATDELFPVIYELDPDTGEANGTVLPFCNDECRDAFTPESPHVAYGREDVVTNFCFVPKCEQCGQFVTTLAWTLTTVSDGDEWFADGAPDNALHAFIFDGKDGHPVVWKVSDLRVDPSSADYEMNDEILSEGSASTVDEAKAEVEDFISAQRP